MDVLHLYIFDGMTGMVDEVAEGSVSVFGVTIAFCSQDVLS